MEKKRDFLHIIYVGKIVKIELLVIGYINYINILEKYRGKGPSKGFVMAFI